MHTISVLRVFRVFALLLALFGLAGCAANDESLPGSSLILGRADDGSLVMLKSDQLLTIELESNPTTGYCWAAVEYDPAVLQTQGEPEFVSETAGQQRVGAGGWEILRFRPVASGQTRLTLAYRRPWENGVEPLESFTVEVTVQ